LITFAQEYENLIKLTPSDRIMSETDCPYVTPVPFRGQRNEPIHVREVVKKMAEIYEKDLDEMTEILKENTERFYRRG
jgi:TatD DNase family protein